MIVYRPVVVRQASRPDGDSERQVFWQSRSTYPTREEACEKAMHELLSYRHESVPSPTAPAAGFLAAICRRDGEPDYLSENRQIVWKHDQEFPANLRGRVEATALAAAALSELVADAVEVSAAPENPQFQPFISIDGADIDVGPPKDRSFHAEVVIVPEVERFRAITRQRDEDGMWTGAIVGECCYLLGIMWESEGAFASEWDAWAAAAKVLGGISYGERRVNADGETDEESRNVTA